jgi:hypothetical protein
MPFNHHKLNLGMSFSHPSTVALRLPRPSPRLEKVLTVSCRPECFWRSLAKPPQDLRHPCPADAQIAGERSPALELAEVEQRLVVAGELERIAGFLWNGRSLWFVIAGTVPGDDLDNGRST